MIAIGGKFKRSARVLEGRLPAMEKIDYVFTGGLSEEEIESHLTTNQTGVLALARDDDAYAIPLVHEFHGDRFRFRLGMTDESRKGEFLDSTQTACYVVYGISETDAPRQLESWSVIARGPVREVQGTGAFDPTEINEQFAPLRLFGEAVDDVEIVVAELEIESIAGRRTV